MIKDAGDSGEVTTPDGTTYFIDSFSEESGIITVVFAYSAHSLTYSKADDAVTYDGTTYARIEKANVYYLTYNYAIEGFQFVAEDTTTLFTIDSYGSSKINDTSIAKADHLTDSGFTLTYFDGTTEAVLLATSVVEGTTRLSFTLTYDALEYQFSSSVY